MWTAKTRRDYERGDQRYPSDLTEAEYALIAPSVPLAKTGGRPRTTDMRECLNGVMYVLRTGCSWRQLPKNFPPWKTVYRIFRAWQTDGTREQLHDALHKATREAEGREAAPTAVIVDAQSTKCGGQKGGHALIRTAAPALGRAGACSRAALRADPCGPTRGTPATRSGVASGIFPSTHSA